MTTTTALSLIADFQEIQKHNPPTSLAWAEASRELKFLFAFMAKQGDKK